MKTRYWNFASKNQAYHVQLDKRGLWLNERKVEIPTRYSPYSGARSFDFQLPIDDLECWCKFDEYTGFMSIFVDGVLIPDTENSVGPKFNPKVFFTIWGIVCALMILLLLVSMFKT